MSRAPLWVGTPPSNTADVDSKVGEAPPQIRPSGDICNIADVHQSWRAAGAPLVSNYTELPAMRSKARAHLCLRFTFCSLEALRRVSPKRIVIHDTIPGRVGI